MADVLSDLKNWSATASSNLPSGSATIGTGLDDNLRQIQATVVQDLSNVGADIASATTTDIGAVAGLFHTITGTTTITGFGTVRAGVWKILTFSGALSITYDATSMITPGSVSLTTAAKDSLLAESLGSGNWKIHSFSRAVSAISADTCTTATNVTTPPKNYLTGLTMSTAGSSATLSVAAGQAADSTNAKFITVAAIAKTTSAWSVGTAAGGLDTGTIANSTWYYFYAILRSDTGVTDIVFSETSTSPTMPANYDYYRYIGAAKTNGSGQWTLFFQYGREFWWDTPALELTAGTSSTGATITCNVPLGRKMKAIVNMSGSVSAYILSSLDVTNGTPSNTAAPLSQVFNSATYAAGQAMIWTDTSGGIRYRGTGGGGSLNVSTVGWLDNADM